MDEPTNHLDLDSSEALIEALQAYQGTLLFVSHNRSFLNGLATVVWEVKDGGVLSFPGNLDDWLYHQQQLEAAAGADACGARSQERVQIVAATSAATVSPSWASTAQARPRSCGCWRARWLPTPAR